MGSLKRIKSKESIFTFCKLLLGGKKCNQNNFIYGELGRIIYQRQRYFIDIEYWLKIVNSDANKMIKHIYNQILSDLEHNVRKLIWAVLVKILLVELCFYEVWLQQNIGDHKVFLVLFKQNYG